MLNSQARNPATAALSAIIALGAATFAFAQSASQPTTNPTSQPVVVPKLWDSAQLADWATPLAGLSEKPAFYSEREYYAAPIDNLRTYPLYHPRYEPPNYRQSLLARGPQPLIEPEKLHSPDDWIKAGQRVFEELDTEIMRTADPAVIAYFSDAAAIDAHRDANHDAMTRDGIILDYRWVVDRDGQLKVTMISCAGCHERLMPDGTVLLGAPCNFDLADSPAASRMLPKLNPSPPPPPRERFYQNFGVPWRPDDPHLAFKQMTDAEFSRFEALDDGAPPGTVFARFNGSKLFATRMADLRGLRDRRYLDATATHKNRGPEDVARYGILVEFADSGAFGPHKLVPELNQQLRVRPPDEAMYALGLYLYSLDPAPSPYPFDDNARRGRKIFEAEGCIECHTPPLYTNNRLVAAGDFDPPENAAALGLNVSPRRVHTDPGLALKTRKGTGYYRIPSLRGLWYRGLYEHDGSVASLEDWFNPKRLGEDFEPTGWKGPGVKRRAVPGHKFGLDLPDEDKKALIAFLKTL